MPLLLRKNRQRQKQVPCERQKSKGNGKDKKKKQIPEGNDRKKSNSLKKNKSLP